MIAPLRRRHRYSFIALAAVLPILVAAAWLKKPAMSGEDGPAKSVPGEVLGEQGHAAAAEDAGFAEHRAELRRFAESIELTIKDPLRAPDVLAYFSADSDAAGGRLPSDAKLLGPVHAVRPNVYPLADSAAGSLLLYSLGHQELLDRAPVEALREPARQASPENATGEGGAP